jgi:hypothetical protein
MYSQWLHIRYPYQVVNLVAKKLNLKVNKCVLSGNTLIKLCCVEYFEDPFLLFKKIICVGVTVYWIEKKKEKNKFNFTIL